MDADKIARFFGRARENVGGNNFLHIYECFARALTVSFTVHCFNFFMF